MPEDQQTQFFLRLINENKGILFKIARSYGTARDEQQDLMQEMMIQIWLALPRYNDNFKISTWIYRICLNVAISAYRKQKRNPVQGLLVIEDLANTLSEESSDHNQQLVQNTEQLGLLERFIRELNEIDRALMLLFLEDRSHAEIAEILGISVSNVGTKTSRIKERLRKKFESF